MAEPSIRKAILIETLASEFLKGVECLSGPRRDVALFKERQSERLAAARSLVPLTRKRFVVRPSLLTQPGGAAAFALGAAAALAASAVSSSPVLSSLRAKGVVSRALEGAASDAYNSSLAALHEERAKKKSVGAFDVDGENDDDGEELRAVLRELRDAKRAPDFGTFAASSSSSFEREGEEGEGSNGSNGGGGAAATAAAVAEHALRAAAGLVFRAGEKL